MNKAYSVRITTAVAVLSAVALGITGCTSSSSAGASTTQAAGSSSPPTVTVGLLFPFSGPAASYGALFDKAVTAGEKVVTDKYGKQFTLKTVQEDSQNTASGATTAMNALASVDGANIVLTSGTAPGLAAQPIAKSHGIGLINGSAVDPKLADPSGAVVNLAPLADQQVAPLIPYAVSHGMKKIAIIHTTDALGALLDSQVQAATKKAGGDVVADISVAPDLTDFSAQAVLVKNADPQAIYLATSVGVQQYTPIFSEFRAAGLDQTMLGFNALNVPQVTSLPGVEGSLLVDQTIDLTNDNWATTDFNKVWPTIDASVQPTSYIVNYANSVIVIGEALHSLVAAHKKVDDASILSAIHALDPATIVGGTITVAKNGTTNQPLGIFELLGNGKTKLVQKVSQ